MCLSTNWVLVKKNDGVKARLCLRGDLEDTDDIVTDSPTVRKVSIRVFYTLALHFGWQVCTSDVKAAFLQGSDLERDVFIRPPKERRVTGVIWKMKKRAYGLVDASRGFYLKLKSILLGFDCQVSAYDPAVFLYMPEGRLEGLLLAHIDDFLYGTGSEIFFLNVLSKLRSAFVFGEENSVDFLYTGMRIVQEDGKISVDQDQYIDSIEIPEFSYQNSRSSELVDDDWQSEFRTLVGKISWVASASRPDLSFNALMLSTKYGKASHYDMKLAVKIARKMKSDTSLCKFIDLGDINEWSLKGYGDAGFKSLPDKVSSSAGSVILVCNENIGVECILQWQSKKIRRVVSSSTAAEALAVNNTISQMIFLKQFLRELTGVDLPLHVYTDSNNLYKPVLSSKIMVDARDQLEVIKIKESLSCGELQSLSKVDSADMLADCLTKKGAPCFRFMNILRSCKDIC